MKTVRHVGLVVRDIDRALHFYRDLLGLVIRSDQEEGGEHLAVLLALSGARARIVKLAAADGSLLELLWFIRPASPAPDAARPLNRAGFTHLAFTVADLGGIIARLQRAGAVLLSPVCHSPDGRVNVVFLQDPEGNYLELVEELPLPKEED